MGTLKFILIAIFISYILSNDHHKKNELVKILEDNNIYEYLNKHKIVFIFFYAPWCKYSQDFHETFEKIAEYFHKKDENLIKFAKVDVTTELNSVEKYEIIGFPTLKLFIEYNIIIDYNKERTYEKIISFIENRLLAIEKINTEDEYENILKSTKNSNIVVAYSENESSFFMKLYKSFVYSYISSTDILYLYTTNKQILYLFSKENELNEDVNLILIKNKNEVILLDKHTLNVVKNSNNMENKEIPNFIIRNTMPIISNVTINTFENIFLSDLPGIFLYVNKENNNTNEIDILLEIAEIFKKQFIFVITGIVGKLEERLAEFANVKHNDLPIVKIHKRKGKENLYKFTMKSKITKMNLIKFIENFNNNIIKDELLSENENDENIKSYNLKSNIKYITGNSFKLNVIDDINNNILVFFYSDDCEFSKDFYIIFEKIAYEMKDYPLLKFMKFNISKNELDNLNINATPLIYLYKEKEKSNPKVFYKEREENLVKEFIIENIKKENKSNDKDDSERQNKNWKNESEEGRENGNGKANIYKKEEKIDL